MLALIVARKNSKRLINKNNMKLGNFTLVERSINFAKKIDIFQDIMISTDDQEILDVAMKNNIISPWLRPESLSKDHTTSYSVALHSLEWYQKNYKKIDNICLIQPSSPYRDTDSIKKAVNKFFLKDTKFPVIAVSPHYHNKKKNKLYIISNNYLNEDKNENNEQKYFINGSFYLISTKQLISTKTFSVFPSIPIVASSPKYSIDIDTYKDWIEAEKYI